MRVGVTGSSGYVGSRIAACLERKGHEVVRMGRRPTDSPWVAYSLEADPARLPLGSLDALVHAAYDFRPISWRSILEINVEGSVRLLEAATQAGVKRIIFVSSMSSFEGCRSNYGKAKRMIEKSALSIGVLVVRPGLVWGGESGGVMGALEKAVASSPVVPCLAGHGGLSQYLVHEDDLCEAFSATLDSEHRAEIVSMAHPTAFSLSKILLTIARRNGLRRIILPVPWHIVMLVLKAGEALRLTLPFRSDSLLGLVYGTTLIEPAPSAETFRPFS